MVSAHRNEEFASIVRKVAKNPAMASGRDFLISSFFRL
jgi:hypothetical protein